VARPVTPQKRRLLSLIGSTETDAAQVLRHGKQWTLATVGETAIARPLHLALRRLINRAVEFETARSVTWSPRRSIQPALEHDQAGLLQAGMGSLGPVLTTHNVRSRVIYAAESSLATAGVAGHVTTGTKGSADA
jgi:hypothetical protein